MAPLLTTVFVFLFGLTFCGLASAILEALTGEPVRFGPPYVSRRRVARSLALSALAGPFMLANEIIDRIRARGGPIVMVASAVAVLFVWIMAAGVLVAELALRMRDLLS